MSALTPTPTAFTPTPTQTRPAIGFESPTSTLAFTSSPTKPPPSTTPTFAAPSPTSSATLTSLPTKTSTLTPTGTPTPRVTPTSPPLPSAMVLVPAGNFIQGSLDSEIDAAIQMCSNAYGGQCPHPREWFTDETPRRTVYLDAFYIDRWEVTNKQFAAFTSATAYQTDAEKKGEAQTWRTFNTTGRENYPAVWMSWNDADAYCTWAGKRLPSEAEWEKAARGDDARIWPWGSNWESGRANTGGSAVAVGSYSTGASPYGVMDMAGNVWEWVADWHDPNWYSNSPLRNPGGPLLGVSRVLRGGGFNNPPWEMRAAHRHSGGQDGYAPDHGFRCAR
ncbi:MAG: hypothetical protein B6I35_13020 [Anaerolineaceae bacterium 4572_32.2]|nr:MAG: hypothetical protein B6I35_13020 [Anaerolineaceae bacterium 4572_32.2]